MLVMGVDGCSPGWVGIVLDEAGYVDALFSQHIGELVDLAQSDRQLEVVGIDIPIGLQDSEREADRLVYRQLGSRRSSLFMTPPRAVLERASDPVAANELSRRLTGKGVSRQSLGLARKVLEVDDWWPTAGVPVIEVHPELSFRLMSGRSLDASKKTWAGHQTRRDLLRGAGVNLPNELGAAGLNSGPDDVLDAAAVAWTARRYLAGQATAYPGVEDRPEAVARIWA